MWDERFKTLQSGSDNSPTVDTVFCKVLIITFFKCLKVFSYTIKN